MGCGTMEYKGYIGKVEFDDDAGLLHGEVVNTRDVITFQGQSVDEVREAFRDSVDDYLAFCAERGEAPEKPFSGVLSLRLGEELHRRAYIQAKEENKSLNAWIADLIRVAMDS